MRRRSHIIRCNRITKITAHISMTHLRAINIKCIPTISHHIFYYIRITKREGLSPTKAVSFFTLEWVKLVPTYHWYTHYNTYLNHGRIQDFRLGARSSEGASYRGAVGPIGVEFREGVSTPSPMGEGSGEGAVPLPRKCLARNGAFCVHSDMIRQFKTAVLIRLKPAKSSDIVTKPCKVVIILRIRNLVMTYVNNFGN